MIKVISDTKTCNQCKQEKSVSEFYKCKNYNYRYECKLCSKVNANKRWKKDKEKIYAKNLEWTRKNKDHRYRLKWKQDLKKKYNITPEDYESMLINQNNGCAICNRTENRRLAVDHCHTTGKVRGLLCTNCNNALCKFKDDVNVILKAIDYIKRNKNV